MQNANVEHKFGSFQFLLHCPAKYMCKTKLAVKSFLLLQFNSQNSKTQRFE